MRPSACVTSESVDSSCAFLHDASHLLSRPSDDGPLDGRWIETRRAVERHDSAGYNLPGPVEVEALDGGNGLPSLLSRLICSGRLDKGDGFIARQLCFVRVALHQLVGRVCDARSLRGDGHAESVRRSSAP